MYNSNSHQDEDADYTMIPYPELYGPQDPPTRPYLPPRRPTHTEHHDESLPEWVKQIEQILIFYRQDLQPESNSQSHVHHQFLLRLIDLVRPSYHKNQEKLESFDRLFQDIIELYERETVKQKESVEELKKENAHWKRCTMISSNESIPRPNPKFVNEDLIQLTESIEHLHGILEVQKERISELIELVEEQQAPVYRPDRIPPPADPDWFQMVLICPTCRAIFNTHSTTAEQFNEHVNRHYEHQD